MNASFTGRAGELFLLREEAGETPRADESACLTVAASRI